MMIRCNSTARGAFHGTMEGIALWSNSLQLYLHSCHSRPMDSLAVLIHTKYPSPQGFCTCCFPCQEHIFLSHMAHSLSPKLQHHLHHLHLQDFSMLHFYPLYLTLSNGLCNNFFILYIVRIPQLEHQHHEGREFCLFVSVSSVSPAP